MPSEPLYLDRLRRVDPQPVPETERPVYEKHVPARDNSESQLKISILAANCSKRLAKIGINVEQSSDLDYMLWALEQMDKPYLTDFLSPNKNDFFEENCFWLVLSDADGSPIGLTGCRADHTGREPLSAYACRKLRNIFPEEEHVPIRPDRLPRVADEIMGHVIYTGDLYLEPGFRSANRHHMRSLTLLLYCLIFLKWRSIDWLYAFLRDRDVRRGAAWMYHFPRTYPMAHSWTSPPSDQSGENWLAAMTRLELIDLFTAYFAAPDRL